MNSTELPLDETQVAAEADRMARWLIAQDTHNADQAQAHRQWRQERQELFNRKGLPRGLRPIN